MMYWLLAAMTIFQIGCLPHRSEARFAPTLTALGRSTAGLPLADASSISDAAAIGHDDLEDGDVAHAGRELLVRRWRCNRWWCRRWRGRRYKRNGGRGRGRNNGASKREDSPPPPEMKPDPQPMPEPMPEPEPTPEPTPEPAEESPGGADGGVAGEDNVDGGSSGGDSGGDSGGEAGGGSSGGSSGGSGGFNQKGELTYYGGAGKGGACTQTWVPSGFKTVAINGPEYKGGAMCGTCVEGCYNENGKEICFKAIIDNKCPECAPGDLDMGTGGDGRWDLEWKTIDCPNDGDLELSSQGSNDSYAKIKAEGGPMAVQSMECDGKSGSRTEDAYFIFNGSGFCGGLTCTVKYSDGTSRTGTIDYC